MMLSGGYLRSYIKSYIAESMLRHEVIGFKGQFVLKIDSCQAFEHNRLYLLYDDVLIKRSISQ